MSWHSRKLFKMASTIRAVLQASGDLPVGEIRAYGGSTAPDQHLLCDGTAVSRTTYAALFAVIGTTYGVGDGSTTFNLPDLQQRFPLGKAAAGTGSTLGGTGGGMDHTHNVTTSDHNHAKGTLSALVGAHFHGKGNLSINSSASSDHPHSIDYNLDTIAGSGTVIASLNPGVQRSDMIGSGRHGHPNADFAGGVGAIGASDNGDLGFNATMDGSTADDGGETVSSAPNNPPYQVVNYIIRY